MTRSLRWILAAGFLLTASSGAFGAGFTLSGATVTFTDASVLSTDADLTLSSGTLNAGSALIQVAGSWTQSGGTFNAGTSTVTFRGTSSSTATLSGSSVFSSLQCTTPGEGLVFQAGSTQTVTGTLTLTGSAGQLIRVRSSASGSPAYLVNTSSNNVSFVNAQDNNASGGLAIRAGIHSANAGNTANWSFGELAPATPVVTAVFSSSITVAWGTVGALTGYGVQASTASDFTGTIFSSVTLSTTTTTLTVGAAASLATDTTYYLRAAAFYNGTTSYAATLPASPSTLTSAVASAQIAQVFITSITANWITTGAAQAYELEASTSPDFSSLAASSITTSAGATTLSVTGLSVFTTYYLRTGGINWNNVPNFVTLGSTQTETGGPPGSPILGAVFSSSITVAWSSAAFATGYEVDASTAADFTGTLFSSTTSNPTKTSLSPALSSDTIYFLRAAALYNGAHVFAGTTPASSSTLTSRISGMEIAQVFAGSVTVNWVALGAAQGYELDASTSSDFATLAASSVTANVSLSTLTISGLLNNISYFFRVGGLNWNGIGNFSRAIAATTGVGAAPDNPGIDTVFTSSITVLWDAVPNTSGYEVDASTSDDFTGILFSSVTSNPQADTLTVGGASLAADTTYFLRIGALYNGVASFIDTDPSAIATLTDALTGIQISNVAASSITVQWTALGAAQGYELDASTSSDFTGALFSATSAFSNTLAVFGLTAGTTYYLRAAGANWDGSLEYTLAGSARTTPGPAPVSPTIVTTLVTTIAVAWGPVNSDDGYVVDASTAADFTGRLISTTTSDGTAAGLTVGGLGPNITYYLRAGSLWNGTTNYALTTPASTTTLTVLTFGTPARPPEITGAFSSLGSDFILSWRGVSTNTDGQPTPIGYYTIERSAAVLGTYTQIGSVSASTLTFTDNNSSQIFFYRVRTADVNNNLSLPSDIIDSSAQINRYVIAADHSQTRLVLPQAISVNLLAEDNVYGDVQIAITRRPQDETGDVLRSYAVEATKVTTGEVLSNFSFSQTLAQFFEDYFASLPAAPAATGGAAVSVAPYWLNGASAIELATPAPASNQPLANALRNTGIYQIRATGSSSGHFALLAGSPYPRILTPNRPNENRRLFFFFQNPSNVSVEATIYDIRGARIRTLGGNNQGPSVNSLVWDVKNDHGSIVPSGVYVYKLEAGDTTLTGTVVVAR